MYLARIAAITTMAFLFSTTTAVAAQACDLSNHCYGIVQTQPSGIDGIVANIDPVCMSTPASNFITSEVWLADSTSTYWVEVGYINNQANIPGLNQGLQGFWGDKRPIDNMFHGHPLYANPALINRSASVQRSSSTSSS